MAFPSPEPRRVRVSDEPDWAPASAHRPRTPLPGGQVYGGGDYIGKIGCWLSGLRRSRLGSSRPISVPVTRHMAVRQLDVAEFMSVYRRLRFCLETDTDTYDSLVTAAR